MSYCVPEFGFGRGQIPYEALCAKALKTPVRTQQETDQELFQFTTDSGGAECGVRQTFPES